MVETQAITVRLPRDVYENLRRRAFVTKRSMNEIIIDSLRLNGLGGTGPLNATERRVWAAWNALPDSDPAPVKHIARDLGMEPADVAFIVFPAETFGRWDDSQEPDLR